ncbi:MAG: hypothetical protein AAGK22_27145, partial [Acidobacteriota bacterium]
MVYFVGSFGGPRTAVAKASHRFVGSVGEEGLGGVRWKGAGESHRADHRRDELMSEPAGFFSRQRKTSCDLVAPLFEAVVQSLLSARRRAADLGSEGGNRATVFDLPVVLRREVAAHQTFDPVGALEIVEALLTMFLVRRERLREDLGEEVFLAFEMPVESACGEACLGHHGIDAATLKALAFEGRLCGAEDALACLGLVTGGISHGIRQGAWREIEASGAGDRRTFDEFDPIDYGRHQKGCRKTGRSVNSRVWNAERSETRQGRGFAVVTLQAASEFNE